MTIVPELSTPADEGFATPSAIVISLAVATLALAVQSRAIIGLHTAQADYARTADEIALDGVQALALQALFGGEGLDRRRAVVELDGRYYRVTAEPEGGKLTPTAAAALEPATIEALGADRTGRVQQGLERLGQDPSATPSDIADLAANSLRWRACARSVISPYGGSALVGGDAVASRMSARVGEVWRIVARAPDGWTDDRTLRIVGDDEAAAHNLDRSFYRNIPGENLCRRAAPPPSAMRSLAPPPTTATP